MLSISTDQLSLWVNQVLMATDMPESAAAIVASNLVQTSLWAIDSHGVSRVPHYLNRLTGGTINPRPQLQFTETGAATGQLDGNHGLGIFVCNFAMEKAISLARNAGVGIVGISNSSHCGAIGLYTRQACLAGMIGIAFTHTDALVVPHLGKKAFFGTNPISIGIPSMIVDQPLCVDMATSIVPWNRIVNARRDGGAIARGLAVNSEGEDTEELTEMVALKPIAEHKGYALGFMIDMLCGPLNGMAFGPHVTNMYKDLDQNRCLGSLMIAIDPQRFAGGALLSQVVTQAIEEVKAQGEAILFPGEPEYKAAKNRRELGIPIEPVLALEFSDWSEKLGVAAPKYSVSLSGRY